MQNPLCLLCLVLNKFCTKITPFSKMFLFLCLLLCFPHFPSLFLFSSSSPTWGFKISFSMIPTLFKEAIFVDFELIVNALNIRSWLYSCSKYHHLCLYHMSGAFYQIIFAVSGPSEYCPIFHLSTKRTIDFLKACHVNRAIQHNPVEPSSVSKAQWSPLQPSCSPVHPSIAQYSLSS